MDLNVLVPSPQTLNCTLINTENKFNIPCLYIDELKEMPYFQLIHDDHEEKIFTELKFRHLGQILSCEEAFEFLDIFEMKNSSIVTEFRDTSYLNELYKNIFLFANQQMIAKIFSRCNFTASERTFNVVDMNGEKIAISYDKSGFYSISFM